ncbi:MAG: BON domain-containing protein [Bacteroidales bacterium]|nr:BON domain-containing protein [Bacteroidales bacterium]
MGLISFIKNAGAKVFKSEEKRETEKAQLIMEHIKKFGFDVSAVRITVDDEKVILQGKVDTLANKNKIIVTAGNVNGISVVEDHLLVIASEPVKPPAAGEAVLYCKERRLSIQKSLRRYTVMPKSIR